MAEFVRRTSAPSEDNAYYYANNPFEAAGYGMPNCTAYAWGRFYEINGSRPALSLGNAENWYGYADGYARGKTPRLGAVICWRRGAAGDSSDGAGHVAIVEAINEDGSIVTSESGWNSSLWWQTTRNNSGGNWGQSSAYTFQGFIYSPTNFDTEEGGSVTITPVSGNRYLSQAEMENNARYIWNYLGSRGWSMNAVAGMLGNMQPESSINPGIWESLNAGNTSGGFGLVQWTPASKYISWCEERGLDPADMDSALQRIEYELANGLQYYATSAYPLSFAEFKVSERTPYYLGMAFLANYERPAVSNQPARGNQAEAWYQFLSELPPPTDPTDRRKKGMSLILLYAASKRKA